MASGSPTNPSMIEEDGGKSEEGLSVWDKCPTEILIMIFEKMSPATLATSMFVNSRWKKIGEHVVENHNMWKDIVQAQVIHRGQEFTLKSHALDWHQIYVNSLLWNHADKATYALQHVRKEEGPKHLGIYKDNLIVCERYLVRYYGMDDNMLRREMTLSCLDFIENDYMIVQVSKNWENKNQITFNGKATVTDFRLASRNAVIVDGVEFYSVHGNECFVMDSRNILQSYTYNHPGWSDKFIARYYGVPGSICGFNVYDGESFLWLKCGSVMWADKESRSFKKLLRMDMMPNERSIATYSKIFHMFGIVFGVKPDKEFVFDRYTLCDQPLYVFDCPNLSYMAVHAEILCLGYKDGIIELYMPRDMKRKDPLKRIDLKMLKKEDRPAVMGIEVCEDNGFQHLIACTYSYIFHFTITYPTDCEKNLWKEYPSKPEIKFSYDIERQRSRVLETRT